MLHWVYSLRSSCFNFVRNVVIIMASRRSTSNACFNTLQRLYVPIFVVQGGSSWNNLFTWFEVVTSLFTLKKTIQALCNCLVDPMPHLELSRRTPFIFLSLEGSMTLMLPELIFSYCLNTDPYATLSPCCTIFYPRDVLPRRMLAPETHLL